MWASLSCSFALLAVPPWSAVAMRPLRRSRSSCRQAMCALAICDVCLRSLCWDWQPALMTALLLLSRLQLGPNTCFMG